MNNNNINEEELKDGNEKLIDKCTGKKRKNPKFRDYIKEYVSKNTDERISGCGDFMQFIGDVTLENVKLHKASFCGNRFCPMCSWRLACKDSFEISVLMEHLRKEEDKEFIFLTLTTPNVKGEDLEESIKNYNKAFKKLMERKEVKQIVKGYIRKLEVTYQKEKYITKELWQKKKDYYKLRDLGIGSPEPNYDTYNPHFHVVIAVDKSYFTSRNYINRDRWLDLWRESTKDFSITQVDVRKSKVNDYKEVYELAKYTAKDTDYLINRKVFGIFYKALKGKQNLVFSGLFKDAHKLYKQHKLDDYKKQDDIKYVYMLHYNWCKNQYTNSLIRELTQEEIEKFNNDLIDEIEVD